MLNGVDENNVSYLYSLLDKLMKGHLNNVKLASYNLRSGWKRKEGVKKTDKWNILQEYLISWNINSYCLVLYYFQFALA